MTSAMTRTSKKWISYDGKLLRMSRFAHGCCASSSPPPPSSAPATVVVAEASSPSSAAGAGAGVRPNVSLTVTLSPKK